MNISDLIKGGNPGSEGGEESDVHWLGEEKTAQNKPESLLLKPVHVSQNTFILLSVVFLSALASLGVGLLAGEQGSGGQGLVVSSIPMSNSASTSSFLTASAVNSAGMIATSTGTIPNGGEVVGDNSTRTYYLPWCKQVDGISKSNEVWFATDKAAVAAGFTAGKACAGI